MGFNSGFKALNI